MKELIQYDFLLKHFNTFGIETKTKYFVEIQNHQSLTDLLSMDKFKSLPKLLLGEGSNILFTKDYDGLVIKNSMKGIQVVDEDNNYSWIKVGAGENWHQFVMYCIQQGLGGLENLSLIPGTVGAAPIQNIGAYGVELSECFYQLEALHLQDSSIRIFSNEECQFHYRDSIFKNKYKNQYMILSVTFKLMKKPILTIDYGNLKELLNQMQVKELTIKAVSDAVIHIRQSKLPDPKTLGNAGSFFKNPIISYDHFMTLQNHTPNIPHFLIAHSDGIKVNAAWLIEQCGWKGKRSGNIGVYDKQALIIVNYGQGSGKEILDLAKKIQRSVQEKFSISLEPEVNLI